MENSDSSAFNSPVHRGGEQDSILGHLDQMHILESEMADDLTVLGMRFFHLYFANFVIIQHLLHQNMQAWTSSIPMEKM